MKALGHKQEWLYSRHGRFPRTWIPRLFVCQVDAIGWCYLAVVVMVWTAGLAIGFVPALKVLTYVALLASAVGIFHPALGLIGITTLCSMNSISQVFVMSDGILRWNTTYYLLVVATVLGLPLLVRLRDVQTRLLQCFIGVLAVGLSFSNNLMSGLNQVLIAIGVIGLVIYCSRAKHMKRAWYWVGLINGTLTAAGGAVYFLHFDNVPEINPNTWALFPLTGIFCTYLAFHFAREMRQSSQIAWLLIASNAGWVFLSGSRGALLGSLSCIFFFWMQLSRASYRLLSLVVLGLLAAVISWHFADRMDYGRERLSLLFDNSQSARLRTSGRSNIAMVGSRMFLAHPFGVGTGAFRTTWRNRDFTRGLENKRHTERAAHSAWIQVLAENGIPGITALGCFVLSFAYAGWCTRSRRLIGVGLTMTATFAVTYLAYEYSALGVSLMAACGIVLLREGNIRLSRLPQNISEARR